MTIRRTEIDGVPTLFAEHPGQYSAGLVFRVGRADETFARSGITHLLEHLVLFPLGTADHHYNGSTGPVTTSFHTSGTEDEIVTFFETVCKNLANPSLDRLTTEKSILKTEWANRSDGVDRSIASWRYGAQGYGLLSFDEPGLSAVSAEDLLNWSKTWFTRENAALWICGERLPERLGLDLPSGQRKPLPPVTSALQGTPAFYVDGDKAVVLNAVLPDRPAVSVFARVLERTLFRDLRQDAGISYTATAVSCARGDGQTSLTALVDSLPDQAGAAVGGLIDVLAKLQVGRIEQGDIESHLSACAEAAKHPDAEASLLPSAAFDLLTDQPMVLDLETYLAELRAVTVEQVRQVAIEAANDALLMVPSGTRADWAGFVAAPTNSESMVAGTVYPALDPDYPDLIIGPDGVSCHRGTSKGSTVWFGELAAIRRWPDGACQLIGNDGFVIGIEPTMHQIDPATLASALSVVPPEKIIEMPARDPERIPTRRPQPVEQKQLKSAIEALQPSQHVALTIASIPSLLMLGLTVILVLAQFSSDPADQVGWAAPLITLFLGILVSVPVVLMTKRMISKEGQSSKS